MTVFWVNKLQIDSKCICTIHINVWVLNRYDEIVYSFCVIVVWFIDKNIVHFIHRKIRLNIIEKSNIFNSHVWCKFIFDNSLIRLLIIQDI